MGFLKVLAVVAVPPPSSHSSSPAATPVRSSMADACLWRNAHTRQLTHAPEPPARRCRSQIMLAKQRSPLHSTFPIVPVAEWYGMPLRCPLAGPDSDPET